MIEITLNLTRAAVNCRERTIGSQIRLQLIYSLAFIVMSIYNIIGSVKRLRVAGE
jgi:hypothetical protein